MKLTPIEAFSNKRTDYVASMLLQKYEGDARDAEIEATRHYENMAGGIPGHRPNGGSKEATFFMEVMQHIADGTEDPSVPRRTERKRFGP